MWCGSGAIDDRLAQKVTIDLWMGFKRRVKLREFSQYLALSRGRISCKSAIPKRQGLIGALAVVAVFWWRMKAYVRSLFSRKTKTNSSESAEANAASENHPDVEQEEVGPKP